MRKAYIAEALRTAVVKFQGTLSNTGSVELGKLIQSVLVEKLDPQNRRLAVPAPADLYLTANTRCPAVLVECGFMSNNFEVLKLKDPAYQSALALVITASYLQYISGESPV